MLLFVALFRWFGAFLFLLSDEDKGARMAMMQTDRSRGNMDFLPIQTLRGRLVSFCIRGSFGFIAVHPARLWTAGSNGDG